MGPRREEEVATINELSPLPLPLPLPHGCGSDFGAAGRQAVAEAEWAGERAARQGVAAAADEINAAGGGRPRG